VKKIRVLLLTNRDSDNVGDQIIEASVISLLKVVVRNLNIDDDSLVVSSRAAGIISKKYLKTGDESLLTGARRAISKADLLIFGGAPLFNYKYQSFYRRTIRTLELANEYGVPVLFSSIGVEPYSDADPRSQALKKALNLPVVRQITTRDDLPSVNRYVTGRSTATALVSDPAVVADTVFEQQLNVSPRPQNNTGSRTIGLVVTRAGIFADNDIRFSEQDQHQLWLDTIALLEERGDDYRLFTTGHFTDEIFLDSLVRQYGVPTKKVAFTVNSPDELIRELSSCDAVIAFRLHASITAFALGIPSVGLSWNFKVPEFYKGIGYPERAVGPAEWNAHSIVSTLDSAIKEGVVKDEEYLYSVYRTLFGGVKAVLSPDDAAEPFIMEKVTETLPRYAGTSYKEYQAKVQRKLRRSYEYYFQQTQVVKANRSKRPKLRKIFSKARRAMRRLG
jgi:polysaccharide pyruvyl transferase WcaK-like protein